MPIVFMQIFKKAPFQGREETFSNVYTLDSGLADLSSDWSGLAETISNAEKAISSADVTWDRYVVWNAGTPSQSVIVDAGDLSGAGQASGQRMYAECALLIEWPLSRSPVLKRRRVLRKWLHTLVVPADTSSAANSGVVGLTAATRDFVKTNYIDVISGPMGPDGTVLTDTQGERPGEGYVKPYLEHHQFHRGT